MSGSPYRMFGRGRLALADVRGGRVTHPDVREWSGESSGCPGAPTGCPEVVRRLSRMAGNGPETLPEVREWS